mgnify:FL=1
MSLIECRGLTKVYGSGNTEVRALKGVDFSVEKGEFVVILGSSGAGKSTLLNILGGMDTMTEGALRVGERNIDQCDDKALSEYRRYDVGFVFQFYNLMPNLTAMENVSLAQSVARDGMDAAQALDLVGLSHRLNNFPAELSGGEQQRVAIARAVVKNPLLLLCDEPTGALDSATGKSVLALLKRLCEENSETVVVVTHNANLRLLADRLIRVQDGCIVENTLQTPVSVEEITW